MQHAFSSLALPAPMLANLASLGYQQMTPIQAASLPGLLSGRDLIAQAKTGSGKTAAFGIGLLHRLNPSLFNVQGLVLCPTRELADQVAGELRRLARHLDNIKILTLCGGVPMGPQIGSLAHGAHLVVGTPGRIQDHLYRATLDLARLRTLVLDEADRMVDMGFVDDLARIVAACPQHRQTVLFSATYPAHIEAIAAPFLRDPLRVEVESRHASHRIEQRFYPVSNENRNDQAAALLRHYRPTSALAFCNTKIHCRELAAALQAAGFHALALYGELEQRDRDEILVRFANQSVTVLVATDVAARGLDIQTLDCVINVDVSRDTEVHVHRIGRTGRGTQKGLALTLASPSDKKWVKLIEDDQGGPVRWFDWDEVDETETVPLLPPMRTLAIAGGKKDKLRPGDLLGALTGDGGLDAAQVGKINVFDFQSYVAIDRHVAETALTRLAGKTIKGRQFKMRWVE
ncbi:ATP-dependent RNA helicase DbpA [Chitiniphilus purpureus]|uniref:ATP-dependent RNA helicase DbpA n=1 Tax=Chitiniphilus purpureus TaxID=2981137 RepID=A0ABY6DM54_9NEIS|nr:ATP-dependent RNA helicase DbpA [Chitiniphilus sp. CD1]UXY14181.1 ATP-dependent RNA helicase DbpA [Chitiniphilus sp. CD1]